MTIGQSLLQPREGALTRAEGQPRVAETSCTTRDDVVGVCRLDVASSGELGTGGGGGGWALLKGKGRELRAGGWVYGKRAGWTEHNLTYAHPYLLQAP